MEPDATLPAEARRDLIVAGAGVLVAAALFSTVVLRPASLTLGAMQASLSLNPFTALGLAAGAAGLMSLGWGRRRIAGAAGSGAILVALVALATSTAGLDIGLGRWLAWAPPLAGGARYVPTTSALCLLVLGAAELVGAEARRWRARSAWLGLLGMTAVALAVVGGLVDLMRLGPAYVMGRGAPMSPVAAFLLATASAAVTAAAWRASGGTPAGRAPTWLPAVTGVAAASATFVLWWALAGQEQASVKATGLAAMRAPVDEIALVVGLSVSGLLALLARLWQQARARAREVEIAHHNLAADVVRHRELEAQLRQSQKMEAVGQLTGGIAHDLNNVLTVVVANAELMAAALPPGSVELRSELDQLRAAAGRGAGMVRRLLAFSRREALAPQPLDLVRVVEESSGLLKRVVPENIEIHVTHELPRLVVLGDGGAIEQVLVNLVTNARDAMPAGGTLRLQTRPAPLTTRQASALGAPAPGEYAALAIADTGAGMDEETRERAFEPFFTTKDPGAGTGLGLSMAYALVRQLGGVIHLASAPGRGTTATVYLPLAPAGVEEAAVAPAAGAATAPGGHETILVVEDEEGIRRAARRVLERHGYRVLLARDGQEGLEAYRAHAAEIDLVISDVIMPRLGGRELYEAVRRDGSGVRFLFASGYASPEPASADLQAVPHIAKPWTLEELLQKVREVLHGGAASGARGEG